MPLPPERRLALVNEIEACLPQTQCGKCKTPGCRPYAEAIAAGEAINHCVPGGADTISQLAALLDEPALPLDPAYGMEPITRLVAFIREDECIGCTKCIQACPVDAIVGAAKLMHTVIARDCTGCELCLPPCPVDCIDMLPLPLVTDAAEKKALAVAARQRFERREARLLAASQPPAALPTPAPATPASGNDKSRVIAAALARTNLKKAERRLAAAQEQQQDCTAILEEIKTIRAQLAVLDQG